MKKFLLTFIVTLLVTSCAPTAQFIEYDIYSYHPYVYGEDGVKGLPDEVSEEGESWVIYVGKVKRKYRPRKKFDYRTTIIVVGRNNYEYSYEIHGKAEMMNGERCYLMHELVNNKVKKYIIIGGKRYALY
jgi:hypothetical protein